MPQTISQRYAALAEAGVIEPDPAQGRLAARLSKLAANLADYRLARKTSALGWLFAGRSRMPPRGLYIFGEVGRGKTMLMDLFFENVAVQRKRRVHFHRFMQDVHARIHAFRQGLKTGAAGSADPIPPVADALADEAWLLCFDEFQVTDIADAMILGRLFERLFARGVVVVATSNVEPQNLYREGLNRALFMPFIHMLSERLDVASLDSRTDFRLEKLAGQKVWLTPDDEAADAALDALFLKLAGPPPYKSETLRVQGRDVPVPRAGQGVARFTFMELCREARGAADYLAMAERYHTIIIDRIPLLGFDLRNETKRFIILIDALYDQHVKLIASAAAMPDALAPESRHGFEFQRTASRLTEMQSEAWLAAPHGQGERRVEPGTGGLVET